MVGGTAWDNDALGCDAGEVCGAWPTLGTAGKVTVGSADQSNLDFVAGYQVKLGKPTEDEPVGWRRLAESKVFDRWKADTRPARSMGCAPAPRLREVPPCASAWRSSSFPASPRPPMPKGSSGISTSTSTSTPRPSCSSGRSASPT